MKRIVINLNKNIVIRFEKIKPFKNICQVSGVEEDCNIEIEYVPRGYVLEIQSFRNRMALGFNSLVEQIAVDIHTEIKELIDPVYLKVTIFLEDKKLTPWNVVVE